MSGHTHNGHERGTLDLTRPAACVGCGCTDDHACPEGCSWLAVDRRDRTGVCSNCRDHLEAWKQSHAQDRRPS
jgi:ferredoxin